MKRVKLNERSWLGRRSFRNLSNPAAKVDLTYFVVHEKLIDSPLG